MRLLLIRHGETVDNVNNLYAGVRDSALTNHGVLQAHRLGKYLAATNVRISHIFHSDLQRARATAEAIKDAQSSSPDSIVQLELLREQDFGSSEGLSFLTVSGKNAKDLEAEKRRDQPGFVDVESKASMRARMDNFLDNYLLKLLPVVSSDHTVAIVAHGIILRYLWRAIVKCFIRHNINFASGIQGSNSTAGAEFIPSWSNTGYTDLEIKPLVVLEDAVSAFPAAVPSDLAPSPVQERCSLERSLDDRSSDIKSFAKASDMSLFVKAVDCRDHLQGLKKTRGGIGSSKFDSSQKTMDSFFKKRKFED